MRLIPINFRPFVFGWEGVSAFVYGLFFSLVSVSVLLPTDKLFDRFFPPAAPDPAISTSALAQLFAGAVFIGPPIETVFCQLLVFEYIGTGSRTRTILAFAASTLIFSSLHLFSGGLPQAARMLLLGAILAYVYCWARRFSLSAAFVATMTTHAAHNAIVLLIALNFPGLW